MAKLLQERAEVEKRLAQLEEFALSDDDEQPDFAKSDVIRQVSYLPLMKLEKKIKKDSKELKDSTEVVGVSNQRNLKKEVAQNVVIIGHIPHGFYEPQLYDFLKQFGYLKGLQLSRSKKTGRSRGYAFVKFASSDVAQIVVKAVNGYMVGDKSLTCKIVHNPEMFSRLRLKTNMVDEEKIATRHNNKLLRMHKLFTKMRAEKLKKTCQSFQSMVNKKQKLIKETFGVEYKIPVTDVEIKLSEKSKRQITHGKENRKGKIASKRNFKNKIKGTPRTASKKKLIVQKNNNKQIRTTTPK